MARMTQQLVTEGAWTEGSATLPARDHGASARARRTADAGDMSRHDLLKRTVEQEVIPRLLMMQRSETIVRRQPAAEAPAPSPAQVSGLVDLLLASDQPASTNFVDAMRALGASAESLYLDLLTPAARRLGAMWADDVCDFSEVTVGLVRLHHIMRSLEPDFMRDASVRPDSPRALLIQMPGEQHGLGISMVVQFFRRAGWDVWNEPVATSADLLDMVRQQSLALVGISVSCSERLEALASDIRAIRRVSRNSRVRIMVGGPIFAEHPQLASMVGADATAADAREAVQQARTLVSSVARHR